MDSLLPRISISELQRRPKAVLDSVRDYAVIQSHGRDRAFVLHPRLGRVLLESGLLDVLRRKAQEGAGAPSDADLEKQLTDLIGTVLTELSRK